jgi:hypothetical protein
MTRRRHGIASGGRPTVFGAYPGVEFRKPDSTQVAAEADVLVILRNGELMVGECKTNARGLNQEELEKLWAAADQVGARATFVATLDRASNCGSEWRFTEAPSGRQHFALTAEHLFDLDCGRPAYDEDLFEWRDDYFERFNRDAKAETPEVRQLRLDERFSVSAEQTGKDYEQHLRAQWTRSEDD